MAKFCILATEPKIVFLEGCQMVSYRQFGAAFDVTNIAITLDSRIQHPASPTLKGMLF